MGGLIHTTASTSAELWRVFWDFLSFFLGVLKRKNSNLQDMTDGLDKCGRLKVLG